MSSEWKKVAELGDLTPNVPCKAMLGERPIGLYRVGEAVFAIDDVCTHAQALLTDGYFEGHVVECPLHGGCFDVRTGKGQGAPITTDLATYRVRIEGVGVYVAADNDAGER